MISSAFIIIFHFSLSIFHFFRGPHRNQALVLFRMGRAEALVALMSQAHSVRSKSRTRRSHLIRILDVTVGSISHSPFAFRHFSFHTVQQTVLDFWPRPLSSRAPSYSGTAATTAGLCISGNKTRLAVAYPSGPLSVLSVLLSSFLFSFLCCVLVASETRFRREHLATILDVPVGSLYPFTFHLSPFTFHLSPSSLPFFSHVQCCAQIPLFVQRLPGRRAASSEFACHAVESLFALFRSSC